MASYKVVTRKSKDLFQFESKYECTSCYYDLKAKLTKHEMTLHDINTYLRGKYGLKYDDGQIAATWSDFTHKVTADDISMRSLSDSYATILINTERKAVSIDEFRLYLKEVLKDKINDFIRQNPDFDKSEIADVVIQVTIEDKKMGLPVIFKEVKDE